MTEPMLIVFGILAGAIVLWSWGRPRADIVAVLVVLGLMLSRVLTPQESFAGFGDPVVILMAAVFIVGEALVNTGVVHRLSVFLLKVGGSSETRLIVLIMLLVGGIGAFMSSTALVAMFVPVVLAITGRTGLNRKRMLMPLAVAATIGSMMTLISTTPSMIVANILSARGLPPLGFFSWTPFGLSVLAAGIAFMLLGRGLLSKQTKVEAAKTQAPSAYDLLDSYGLTSRWHRLQVPAGSPLIGRSVAQLRSLYDRFGVIPVGFEKPAKGKTKFLPALPETIFETGDAIFVIVGEEQAQQLIETQKLIKLPRLDERQAHEALQELGVAELMLAPESKLISKTVSEIEFRSRYHVSVLALRHRGERLTTNLAHHRHDFGDTLLIAGGWDAISRLRDDRENFVVLTLSAEYQERLPARRRAPVAVAILAMMAAAMASGLIHISAAALLAALAMLATRCVPLDAMYRVVSWKTFGMWGKWHLGSAEERFPTHQGFDEWYGIPRTYDEAMWPSFNDTKSVWPSVGDKQGWNAKVVPPEHIYEARKGEKARQVAELNVDRRRTMEAEITTRAVDFIKRNAKEGKPFYAYVSFSLVHMPTLPNPEFAGKTGNGDWADCLAEMDHRTGQILDAIKEAGIEDNTLVVFTSDNGPEETDPWQGASGPWRSAYFTAMEGSLRVPFIIRWPGKVPAGRVSNEIVHIVDMFTTLARVGGAEVPKDRPIDGVDQLDFFLGKQETSNREGFPAYVADRLSAVKWRNWKAHFIWQEKMYDPPLKLPLPKLINLLTDLKEERDVLAKNDWVLQPMVKIIGELETSFKKYPPIKVGTPDPYVPPKE